MRVRASWVVAVVFAMVASAQPSAAQDEAAGGGEAARGSAVPISNDLSEIPEFTKPPSGVQLGGVGPGVEIRAVVETPGGSLPEAALKARGLERAAGRSSALEISGDADSLARLVEDGLATSVVRVYEPEEQAVTEGLSVIGADRWHGDGIDGTGVKVAIVDGGFTGYTSLLGSDLPASVSTQSFHAGGMDGSGAHGTAVAEIVHDVAPGAELHLIAIDTSVDMQPLVDHLIAQDIEVVNMSLAFLAGPYDGTTPVAVQVKRATDAGIVWVNSAGNYRQDHWGGGFVDSDADGWHNFFSVDELNSFETAAGDVMTAYLGWSSSTTDFELCIYDLEYASPELVGCSVDVQGSGQRTLEAYSWLALGGTYGAAVWHTSGPASRFDLFVPSPLGLDRPVEATSIPVPAELVDVVSVGATPVGNPTYTQDYSSVGPTVGGDLKPDIVAPDGVSTTAYGSYGFFGTSAASPHVAGMVALLFQGDPAASSSYIRSLLRDEATPFAGGGTSYYWGHGLATMPPEPTAEPEAGPPEVVSLTVDPDSVPNTADAVITFDLAFTADAPGFDRAYVFFTGPTSGEESDLVYADFDLVSGTVTEGVVRGQVTIPAWAEPGSWKVHHILMYDDAGRSANHTLAELEAALVPLEAISVTGSADETAPTLTMLTFSPSSVENTSAHTVVASMSVTDDVSGFESGTLYLESPSGGQTERAYAYTWDLNSGTLQDGVLDVDVGTNLWAEPGEWQLDRVYLRDAAGHGATYDRADLIAAGASLSPLTITGELDVDPPSLSMISIAPGTVDNAVASDVTVGLSVADDVSGFSSATVRLRSPSGDETETLYLYDWDLESGTVQDGVFSDTIAMDQWAEPGVWTVYNVTLRDDVGHSRTFSSLAALEDGGVVVGTLTVTGEVDTGPPVVTSLSLAPLVFDNTASQTVTVEVGVADDVSGVSTIRVRLDSASGSDTETEYLYSWDLYSGSAQEGVLRGEFVFDAGSEVGEWTVAEVRTTDALGNVGYFDTEELTVGGVDLPTLYVHDGSGLPTAVQDLNLVSLNGGVRAGWGAPLYEGEGTLEYEVEIRIAPHAVPDVDPASAPAPQIVGGDIMPISQVPWQGAMLVAAEPRADYGQFCGASLIAPRWAVTAAHCVEGVGPDDIDLMFGQSVLSEVGPLDRVGISRIIVHPAYNDIILTSDIALLELEAVPRGAEAIGVPFDPTKPTSSSGGIASGWGNFVSADPEYAQYLPDPLLGVLLGVRSSPEEEECEQWGLTYDNDHHLCAGNSIYFKGTCVGDSGGPFAVVDEGSYFLYGVTSFGAAPESGDCGHPYVPSVFSRVTSYAPWIAAYVDGVAWTEVGTTSATSMVISGLESGFRYEVRVTAINDSGESGPVTARGTVKGDRLHDLGTTDGLRDPGFELGPIEASKNKYIGEGGTWTVGSSGALVGTGGAVFDSTGQSGLAVLMVNGSRGDGSRHIQVSAGDVVGFSALVNTGPGATNRIRPRIHFFDADGKYLSGVTQGPTRPKGVWTWMDVAGVAPTGAAFAMFQIRIHNDGNDGEYYVDQIRVHGPDTPTGGVSDPGFESGSVGASRHKFVDEGGSWSVDPTGAMSGSYGAVYNSTGQSGLAVLMVNGSRGDGSRHVQVEPGGVVGFSAWVNTGPGATNRIRPRIHFFDANGKYLSGITNGVFRPKGNWTWMGVAGVVPEGAAFAMFQVRIHDDGNDGEYYVDDLWP